MRRLVVVVNDDFTGSSHYQHLTTHRSPDFPNPIREQFGLFHFQIWEPQSVKTSPQLGVGSLPQGANNWSSFLLFRDNWKISISLRLNSTVSSNEPIECQSVENKRKYNRLASLLALTFLTRMLTQVVVVVAVAVYCQHNIYYPNTPDRHELYYCKLCKLSV